jgi:hypothetical protein
VIENVLSPIETGAGGGGDEAKAAGARPKRQTERNLPRGIDFTRKPSPLARSGSRIR